MSGFQRLDAWRLGHELTLQVYRVSTAFPAEERFGLVVQVRRAAASVPANIAEGCGSPSHAEFRRYLRIASRSLDETGYWLMLARDLEYLEPAAWRTLDALRHRTGKVIWNLIRSLDA